MLDVVNIIRGPDSSCGCSTMSGLIPHTWRLHAPTWPTVSQLQNVATNDQMSISDACSSDGIIFMQLNEGYTTKRFCFI
jgi:hypothetical protein